jgi:hypothetical protein
VTAQVVHLQTARLKRAADRGSGDAAMILAYRAERDTAIAEWRADTSDGRASQAWIDGFNDRMRREQRTSVRVRRWLQYRLTQLADMLEPSDD